jgi:uncharacterized protein YprB with RNaseH-like and TPR domain
MNRLYNTLGKSFRACGRELDCASSTFQKYYNNKLELEGIKSEEVIPVTMANVPKLIAKNKKVTKSAGSGLFLNPDSMKVAVLDIETTSLKSDFGIMLCAVIRTYGSREDPKVFRINLSNPSLVEAEKEILIQLNEELTTYDGLITYFGNRFDIPFIRTRALYHGIQPLKKTKSLDLYFTVKRVTNPSTRRLERINQILQVSNPDASPDKTKLGLIEWNNVVLNRDNSALDYIVTHCIADIMILENVVNKFIDFIPDRIMRS